MEGEALFPIMEAPEFTEESEQYDEGYKYSIAWDMEKGDFVRNGANQLIKCDGGEAYKIWCYKAAKTERFSCLAYSDSIGTEIEDALKEKSNEAVESAIERTITEALMVNPKTEFVQGFSFDWNGDELRCEFIVKAINLDEFSLTVTIGNNVQEVD